MARITIPEELFYSLLEYFYPEDGEQPEGGFADEIRQGLLEKVDAILTREVFSKYKRAILPSEREKLRQLYLDRKGIPATFRTSREIPDTEL